MATTLTCDHCQQPVDRTEHVRIDISDARRYQFAPAGKDRSLAERAKQAAAEAAAIARQPTHIDLHPHCYDEILAPAINRIGGHDRT